MSFVAPYLRRPATPAAPTVRRLALAVLLAFVLAPSVAPAQSTREAERKLQKLRSELKGVAQERRQLDDQRGAASRQLREMDQKVARTGRSLAETDAALKKQNAELGSLQQRRATLQGTLQQQKTELAGLLRGAHRLGNNAPLKLLLSQDTVAGANRALAYHRYLQRERSERIHALTADLQALDTVERQIAERQQALQQARQQQARQSAALEADRKARAAAVATLEERFNDRAEREKALGQDAKALETLLANLRAAAARAAAERRAAERRAAAEKAAEKAAADKAVAEGRPAPRPTRTPPAVASAPAPKVGGLGWPLSGNLLARFGGRLPDGRTSSGVLIGAPAGSTVTAVADGTVVFSDWMTGYGMILIIDHGNGYMSLYAHNDALLKDAGVQVKRGDAVAKVGNSGGQGVTALYFELRRGGQPVNPDSWLQRR